MVELYTGIPPFGLTV